MCSKPEWKEQIDNIKRRLEGRRSRCDELSEKEFEIYLEMKLQWLQQFYVAANSTKSEKKTKESEDEGWNEDLEEDLKFQKLHVIVNHQNQKRNEVLEVELKSKNSETYSKLTNQEPTMENRESYLGKEEIRSRVNEKFQRENSDIRGESLFINIVAKPEGSEGNGDDREPPPLKPKDSTATAADRIALLNEVWPTNRLGEIILSHETEGSGGEEEEEKSKRNDGAREGRYDVNDREPPPEPPDKEVAMAELQCAHDLGVQRVREFSLSVEMRNREEWEKKTWAEVDSFSISLGQAQVTVSKSAHIIKSAQTLIFTPTQFIINEEALQVKRKMDPVTISLGQTHKFITTPPIFTNTGRALQVVDGLNNQRDQLSSTYPLFSKPLGVPITVEGGKWSHNILSSFMDVKTMGRYGTWTSDFLEEFAHMYGASYGKNIAATILCFVLKNAVENKTFDPGGNFSVVAIGDQCFNIFHPLPQYMCLSFTVESFMALLNFYIEEYATSLALVQDHKKMVEFQAWNHINPWVQGESEISKEAIELLYEWHMGLGDLSRTLENKPLEFHDKEEEDNSGFTEFKRHQLMVEHLIHRVESSRIAMMETHHRQWDLGEPYSASCIIETSCFKLWDPGGRVLIVCFGYLHLEDKVNV